MKKMLLVLSFVMGFACLAHAAAPGTVLFSDSYDRADSTDIDSSSVGMSGTLAPMVYQEVFEGSNSANSIQVIGSELNIAVGAGMSSLYLDHNFTDASILSADGFSVSLDVAAITDADDWGNRFGGFGVGATLAEAQSAGDAYDGAANSLRPALHLQGEAVADFYVDLALDSNLRIWDNGNVINTVDVGATSGTITVDFFVADFNAGSEVTAVVYFNGVEQAIETFTWEDADANYIGISGRTAGNGVFLDNLEIATIYEDRANNPIPADGATLVNASGLALSWNKGKDGNGNPNALIDEHLLYIAAGEPNFAGIQGISVPDTADPVSYSNYSFDSDTLYFWRVDESVGTETITGYVWSFDTYTFPIVANNPGQAVAAVGGTASLSCDFTSITTPSVKWFKEAGDVDQEITSGGNYTIDLVAGEGDAYTSTLTFNNAAGTDEGEYYCQMTNSSGSANAVSSEVGTLGVKRKVAHWTMDEVDVVNDQYVDQSGEGHNADPNAVPLSTDFVDGVDVTKTVDGLNLAANPQTAAHAGEWVPAMYTGEITFSAWLNWDGANGSWQGVVSNRVGPPPATNNFYVEIRQDNGNLQLGGIVGDLQAGQLPTGEWTHLAITAKAGDVVIYINGEAVADSTSGDSVRQNVCPVIIGALGRDTGAMLNSFNGSIDDVQIYNYAMTAENVIDELYYPIREKAVCLNPNPQFDIANAETGLMVGDEGFEGDCVVNIHDFAAFAINWLDCGLYPVCP